MNKFWNTIRKPWVAQIALALAVAYSVASEHSDAADGRTAVAAQATAQSKAVAALAARQSAEVAASTKNTLIASCAHGNDLRNAIRGLIAQEIPAIKDEVKKGRLSPAEAAHAVVQVRQDLGKVKDVNCARTYSKIR